MLHRATSVIALLALASCNHTSGQPAPAVERIELAKALGSSAVDAVGVTVSPVTGTVYLLDANLGLYSITKDGEFRQVADPAVLYQVPTSSLYTDVASLGNGRFALTAVNDGFLLDLSEGTVRQHFCYVPGSFFIGSNPPTQLTRGVAFDAATQRIIAQPITLEPRTLASVNSEVGTFPITGGEGEDWHPIPDSEFLAGGIAVDGQGTLWLGQGAELHRYDLVTDTITFDQSLERFEVTEISGMAFDGTELLVIDAPSQSLLRIPPESLGL